MEINSNGKPPKVFQIHKKSKFPLKFHRISFDWEAFERSPKFEFFSQFKEQRVPHYVLTKKNSNFH